MGRIEELDLGHGCWHHNLHMDPEMTNVLVLLYHDSSKFLSTNIKFNLNVNCSWDRNLTLQVDVKAFRSTICQDAWLLKVLFFMHAVLTFDIKQKIKGL